MKIKTFWNDIYEYDGTQIICSEMLLAECRQYIKNKLTRRELLEQLAEECSELTKAAMKTIRAEELSENPTPTSRVCGCDDTTDTQFDAENGSVAAAATANV